MKWENKQVVDEYRKDEVDRGHADFEPDVQTNILGFLTLAIFIVLVLIALVA